MELMKLAEKEGILRAGLASLPSLVVAYSGGVDSAYLLHVAHEVLGERVHGILADSPSLPRHEHDAAIALASARGWPLKVIVTRELDNPLYVANPLNRCYYCKQELFDRLDAYAQEHHVARLAYGENADDAGEFRPGQMAANELCVLAPLRDAGLTKAEIRELSRRAGLPTADKAAQPCLSSRLPTGHSVTIEALAQIEAGEKLLRESGFRIYRLRHLGETARVQVAPEELPRLSDDTLRQSLAAELNALGFAQVEFDPEGYRGASLR